MTKSSKVAAIAIEMLDGSICSGDDARAVITNMRESSWGGVESDGLKGYMEQVSKRVHDWNGSFIRVDSYVDFLADCAAHGIIRFQSGKALIMGAEK